MKNQNTERLAKNTGFLYLRMIVVMCISLFTSRVVINTLGLENFGIYNVIGTVVVFFSFLQAAMRNATSRYLTYEIGCGTVDQIRKMFSMSVNAHVILAVVMLLLLELGGVWFINNKLNISESRLIAANWTFQFSLLTFCVSIVRTPYESKIIAYEKMDFYAMTSIVEVLLKLALVYLLLVLPIDKLITYSFLLFLIALVLLIWYVFYCNIKFPDSKYCSYWDFGVILDFTKYSGWSVLVNGACIVRSQSINIFFNMFLGVIANAAMGIANQVISAINSLISGFTQAFRPQLIKSWATQDIAYFNKLIYMTSKISYLLLLFIGIPVICNIDFILKVWLGQYPEMTSVYIQTIILYYLIDALQEPLIIAVHATGKLKYHQIMVSVIVFIVVPTSYIMLKSGFSGTSVLVVNAASNVICAVGRIFYMRKLIALDLGRYLKDVVCPITLITVLALPIPLYMSYVLENNWINFIRISVVSVFVMILLIFFVGLNKNEKTYVISVLQEKLSIRR